jgi:hypothetical protein
MYYSDKDVDNTDIVMITWDNGVISVIESGCWQPHMYSPEEVRK